MQKTKSKDLPLHRFFDNNKYIFIEKCKHDDLQIFMHCPYMLVIYFKGKMLNFRIYIQYPSHMDVLMLALQQPLKVSKNVCSKVGSLLTIHVQIPLVNLDNNHEVTNKNILHMCKLNEKCTNVDNDKIRARANKTQRSHYFSYFIFACQFARLFKPPFIKNKNYAIILLQAPKLTSTLFSHFG